MNVLFLVVVVGAEGRRKKYVKNVFYFFSSSRSNKTYQIAPINHSLWRIIEILKETYVIEIIRPYYKNKNKELIKIPKIYFIDNGVRNYFINNFNKPRLRDDSGFLFEGIILSELIKYGHKNIKFWQNKNVQEVDFILEQQSKIIPIEVKFKKEIKTSDFTGTNAFINTYKQTKKTFLVNLNIQKKEKKTFFIIPYTIGKQI